MKFHKILLTISIVYYLVNLFLLSQIYEAEGVNALGAFITLLFFQGLSLLIIGGMTIFYSKRWLTSEYGSSNKLLLLSYLIIPLISYLLVVLK